KDKRSEKQWREKRNVFFSHSIFHIYFIFQSIHKFHLSGISYPVPTHQKWLPIRQNPDAYSFSGQLLPVGRKGGFGKVIVNYS
ncbi:hypothetical protein, partial [Parabacteroides goldsteinii]|uniref:hypothetical protein n=1 Tax=Parabacteroides goldsteinii TaxID=328812 RepID=UPI003F73FD58